ncbi:MAG TPA: maleylpyruvate isomerase N-terminal domain-containing protein [Actinomycetota bacterium]|nr:maleylpyruvate isomerase N-terminal domain-containing protein [Actinomycetota bacterium]
MPKPTPLWKMPTRAQAKEVLISSRERTLALVEQLDQRQMKERTQLGGGAWSVKDLLGHLSGYEEQAVALATGKKPRFDFGKFASVDGRNAADIERKRTWTVKRVLDDLGSTRASFLEVIGNMDDERWTSKIQTRSGRSALALVLGKLLVGGHHGLFAHDLAHHRDLEKSIKLLKEEQ